MFDYFDLKNKIKEIEKFADVKIIGQSLLKRNIYAINLGKGERKILFHGAIHARESITARLLIELAFDYSKDVGITIIPMVNPDGVDLCSLGLDSIEDKERRDFLLAVNKSSDFTLWKANAAAVDLNVNFDAGFGKGVGNLTSPASSGYIGKYPFSEPESKLLKEITDREKYILTLSYHARGEVVYYGYENIRRHEKQAREIAKFLNYDILSSEGSHGGYKDWYTLNYTGLGLTVEVGEDGANFPISENVYEKILKDNKNIINFSADIADEISNKISY